MAKLKNGTHTYREALNPLDLPPEGQLQGYDIVPMPPTSLIRNVTYSGAWWENSDLRIPANMAYLRRSHV
jgi:hypothetical protein